MEKKTSEEWQKLCRVKVIDPDGWDRQNFDYSWYEELITTEEFEKRLRNSTVENFLLFLTGDMWKGENNAESSTESINR